MLCMVLSSQRIFRGATKDPPHDQPSYKQLYGNTHPMTPDFTMWNTPLIITPKSARH